MKELIERLERATGPDQDVDIAIHKAVHPRHDEVPDSRDEAFGLRQAFDTGRAEIPCPSYTASLDAALTLVPEGWTWAVDATAPECRIDVDLFAPGPYGARVRGVHDSEPIATVIAALRAREQGK